MDSRVACTVPTPNWSAWIIGLATSAGILDVVFQNVVVVA